MYAHYFKYGKRHYIQVAASNRPALGEGKTYEVSGKREARKVAKENNAQPWNF